MDVTITAPRIKDETKPAPPKLHKVILLNDDYTPRAFVVRVLKAGFGMGEGRAYGVMMTTHRLGSCVVAVFTQGGRGGEGHARDGHGPQGGAPAHLHHGAGGVGGVQPIAYAPGRSRISHEFPGSS